MQQAPPPSTRARLNRFSPVRFAIAVFLCLAMLISMPVSMYGATFTWTPTAAGTFTWNTAGNWTGGVPTNTAGDTVSLTANLAGAEIIDLNVNATTGTLNIGDPTTAFFGYTLQSSNSSALTFDNGASAAVLSKAAAATASDAISTNIILAGSNANLNITNLNANTTGLLTLSGNISETGGAHNLVIAGVAASSNGVTVLSGNNSFTGSVTVNSGTLRAVGTNSLNSSAVNAITLAGGTLDLRADGNGTDSGASTLTGTSINTENISYGDNVTVTGSATINVDRVGGYTAATASSAGTLFQTPANKNIQLGTLTLGAQTLTVTNASAYGLEFTGAVSMTGSAVFSVSNASVVNVLPGLTLSGVVSGAFSPNKVGAGTMLLTNSGNSFTGNINISNAAATAGGIFAVTNDGALGNSANDINIGSGVSTASSTFGAFDSFTLSNGRTLNLNSATNTNNNILVAPGKTLTLATASQLAGLAANGFQKTDEGTLLITADNASKSGAVIVAGGILQLNTSDGTGSGAITVNTRAQLSLSGAITEASAITINGVGPQNGGALQAVSGSSTASGAITLGAASTIGAASGATLNLTNATAVNGAFALTVANEGTVVFAGNVGNTVAALNTARTSNIAGPTVTIATAQTAFLAGSTITLAGGTFNIGNAAGVGNLPASGTGLVNATVGSTLNVNNSVANVNNRLGSTRPLTLQASTFNYTGNGTVASNEALGTLALGAGSNAINISGGTAANPATITTTGLASNIVNVGGFLVLTGSNFGTDNRLVTTAAPTLVNGVIQRAAYVNGTAASLVTGAAASAITAATLTSATADLNNTVGATSPGGVFTATNNAQLTSGTHLIYGPNAVSGSTTAANTTVNALVMDSGSATTITGVNSQALTITSGNVLVAGSTAAVIGNTLTPNASIIIAQGTVPSAFMVNTGSTLELAATITSGTNTGLQKALDGSMNITGKQFFSTGTGFFDINGGTVKLAAGDHTLAAQQVNIAIAPGATLDLNGTVLETNALASSNASALAGSGGTITNTAGTQATLVARNGGNFGGQITGNIFVGVTQSRTLSNNNTYTGKTLIAGGTTTITDLGRISGTSGAGADVITINGGVLTLTDAGTVALSDRVNDSATITMRTGTINYTGRDNTASSETLGVVTLAEGASQITVANGANGTRSTDLILSGLTRSSADAAININTVTADIGSQPRLLVTGGLTNTNNIIGGWAVTGGADFVSYNNTYGVGNLTGTGMAGYDRNLAGTQTFTNLAATENIKNTGTFASILGDVGGVGTAGNIRINSLVLNPGATSSLTFADALDTLYVASGGMIRNGAFATTIGSAVDTGRIAAGDVGATGLQTMHFHNTGAATTTLNSRIVDNSGTAATRLVFDLYNQGAVTMSNPNNSYTGGTVLNGWTGNTGNSNSGTVNASALNTIPAGGVTINNALLNVTVVGGINAANDVTLNMGAGLTLPNGTTTLNSLTLNASGFSGAGNGGPTVTIGSTAGSVLNLTNPTVTASSNNATGVGAGTITAGAASFLNFGGNTAVFNIDGVKENGVIIDPWAATLNVATNVGIQNANGLTKTGNGVLQLSGQSTFGGGVNLSAGGLMIGGSSSAGTRPLPASAPVVTSGPLGTGTLTIGSGTRLLSSAAANAVGNQITIAGNFEFDGVNNLTLNGDTSLGGSARSISVNTPQMTATLGGVVSNGGITKEGYGTLILNNVNTFAGGATVNNGTLVGQLPGGANPGTVSSPASPFGTGAITYNGGVLSIRSQSGEAFFNNDINVNSSLPYVNLDVQGGNQITMGNLNLPMSPGPLVTQVNVTGSTGSILKFLSTNIDSNGDGGLSPTRVTGDYQVFNVGTGVSTVLMDAFYRNNEPLNIGAGNLLYGVAQNFTTGTVITASGQGAAPLANASTAIYGAGQSVTFTGGTVGSPILYNIAPQSNTVIGGATTGGLQQQATNVSSGNLNASAAWGNGITSGFNGVLPNDAALDRVNHTNATLSTLGTYNGYLNVTGAGTYSFILGSDDYSSLVIDGVEVARDITTGHGVQDSARGSIVLAAGQHSFTFKVNVGTGTAGGGLRLLYSGPDTAVNGTNNGYQAIDPSRLSYFSGPANAGNNYYNAAQVDNDYILSAAAVATLQGLGADYNSTIKSLTMGAGSQLNAVNDLGTAASGGIGFIGVKGVTDVSAGTAVLSPTTAQLYLIGGINDGAAVGLTKAGTGTLHLNNSTAFTGAFAITAGTVVLRETDALTTGMTTVTAGASIDLYGVGSSSGRAITLNGTGTASQIGAIYNSQATTATLAGNLTIAASSQVAGYGDMIFSGTLTSASGITLTKAGSDTLTITGSNTATLLGPVATTGGILNNGALNSGVSGALGASTISVGAGSVLNLSGNNIAASQTITVNGTSIANIGPNGNTLGNLINSSISNTVASRNAVTAGSNAMQLANTANTSTISANVVLNTATTGIGSNTFATGGDIVITGIVSGGQALTKVGGDTLTLRGANTYSGGTTVHYGTLKLDQSGTIQGAGGTVTVNAGASLIIDNTGTVVQNRLNNATASPVVGNNKTVVLAGGTLSILGNSATAVTETANIASTGNVTGININQGQNYINLVNNGANVTLSTMGIGTGGAILAANGGTVLITGKNLGSGTAVATNTNLLFSATGTSAVIGQGGANAANNKAIIPWAIVDNTNGGAGTASGVSFATLDSAAATTVGLRPLAAGEYATTLAANVNMNVTATTSTATLFAQQNLSINSLTLATGSAGLTLAQGTTLNLQSGGILATQSNTISGPGIFAADSNSAVQTFYINTYGSGTTLTISANFGSTQANTGRNGDINKSGAGTLVLSGSNFDISNTRIQEGTLKLGSASAIYYRLTTPAASNGTAASNNGPTLQINGAAVLDLNGFDFAGNNLNSINPGGAQGSLSGGSIINSVSGTRTVTINTTTNNTWAGNIASGTGTINFNKYGNNTFTVANSNTYTGATVIGGGATTLVDLGAFRATSGITINQATLIWNDGGSQADPYRLGVTPASITMNGGGFQYSGRQGDWSVANLGAVTLNRGASQITVTASTLGSATVVMTGLTRSLGTTLNFGGSVLGDDGYVKVSGTAPTNYNGIVGGWATVSSSNPYVTPGAGDFVSYDPVTGFRAIVDYKTTGGISYASGNANQAAFGASAFAAGNNIRVNSNTTLNAGTNSVNAMVIGSGATTTLTFGGATDTLYVQSGGILGSTDAQVKNIGGSVAPLAANLNGYITAGNSDGSAGAGNAAYELFLQNVGNTLQVNSQIVDNGANAVNLVTSMGTQNGVAIRLNNTNTYTGTTTVNTTDLRLNSLAGPAIANSLNIIVNGGTETAADSGRTANGRILFEQSNQLNTGATVTLNDGVAALDLNGFNQTLSAIVINNRGGSTGNATGQAPGVRTGTGTLTLTNGVTVANLENTSTISNISGNILLPAGQHTFSVDQVSAPGAAAQVGLSINAEMSGTGGIDKTGTGVMALTGVATYSGPTNINNGTLVLGGFDNQGTPVRIVAQIPNSQFNVGGSGTVDMRGGNAYIGSLAGSGVVTNSVYSVTSNGTNGNPGTLFLGLDNTSTGDFSGTFTNFINGANQATGFGLSVTKLGSGMQTISGNNAAANTSGNGDINNTGTLDILEGGINVNGANGSLGFTSTIVRAGGTLTLDDSISNKANRLGGAALTGGLVLTGATQTTTGANSTFTVSPALASTLTVGSVVFGPGLPAGTLITAINTGTGVITTNGTSTETAASTNLTFYVGAPRTISMQGGTITFKEGAGLISETLGNVTLAAGSSVWSFDRSVGSTGASITLNAMTAGSGTLQLNVGGSQGLGSAAAGAGYVNVFVTGGMNGQGSGSISVGAAVNAVAGLVGGNLSGIGIRPDITGVDQTGAGVVTYDVYGYRLLSALEYNQFPNQPNSPKVLSPTNTINPPASWAAVNPTTNVPDLRVGGTTYTGNILATSQAKYTTNTTIASLRLDSGGSIFSQGGAIGSAFSTVPQLFNPLGLLNTVTVTSGVIIANTGNGGLTSGAISAGGSPLVLTTASGAALNADAYLISTNTTTGLVKEGAGVLNLTKQALFGSSTDVGATMVNGGTLNLSAGPNTLTVINTALASGTAFDSLTINAGATVDMKGNDQTIGNLVSADITPGGGGILTNSGAIANLYTNANSTFGGSVNGAINLFKTGSNTLTLANANGYTGTTNVQGGILNLQDSGTLASTTYNLNGGQLRFDERSTQLTDLTPRIPLSSVINFRSGTLLDLGGPTTNATQTFTGAVSILQGQNEIRQDAVTGASSRNMVFTNFTIPTASNGATVHFNSGNGNLGETGTRPSIVLPSTPTTIGGIIPWAVAQTDQPAMYNASINPNTGLAYGVAVPNVTGGATTTANYANTLNTGVSGNNINVGTTAINEVYTQLTRTFNSFRFSQTTATTHSLNSVGNELMRVEAGVIITNQQSMTLNNGRITAGLANNTPVTLYDWAISNTQTLSGQIVDNGTGALTLSKNGAGTLALTQTQSAGIEAVGAASNTTVAGSTTVTLLAAPATAPTVGMTIIGPGIPNGATITAVAGNVLTISAPAFATTNGTTVGYGASQLVTGTNAAVSSGAVGALAITVTNGALHFVGQTVTGTGIPAGVTIASIAGNVVTTTSFTASAAIAANQAFGYTGSTNISTNSAYTGNTIVNLGTLALNGAVGSRAINAGSLTINNGGAVTMTNAGQIAPTTDVVINGGGTLTFAPVTLVSPATGGINAINSLTFNNYGGTVTPLVAGGTNGIVTVKNGLITVNSDNQGSTASVTGVLNFGQVALGTSGANTITVTDVGGFAIGQTIAGAGITGTTTITGIAGNVLSVGAATTGVTGSVYAVNQAPGGTTVLAPTFNVLTTNVNELTTDLSVGAVISNSPAWNSKFTAGGGGAALTKTGNGSLTLSGASTFDNGVNLNQGTLIIGAASTGTGVVTSGPLGTGVLTIAGGTTIMANSTARTVGNNVVINGDFIFGGQQAGHSLTLSGNVAMGSSLRTFTVSSPTVTATLSGSVSGTSGLTKAGNGILVLSGGNTYTGTVTAAAGLLKAGSANALPLASANALVVNQGGAFDVNAQTLFIGSLAGDTSATGGLVTNSGAAATLNVGTANTGTSFAGVITNAASALNLGKVGTGTLTLVGVSSYTGNTTVNNGTLTLNSTGQIYANMNAQAPGGTIIINAGGTINVDNTATNVANRLGGNLVPMTLAGGTLNVTGNASAALTENLGAVTVNGGMSTINLAPGAGGTNSLTLASYTYTSGTLFMSSTGATGTNGLGLSTPATGTTNVTVVGTAPALTNGILAYGTGDDGTNQGFLTYDAIKGFRVITSAELTALTQLVEPTLPTQTGVTTGLTSTTGTAISNYSLASTINVTQDTVANSLTLASGGGLLINGGNLVTGAGALINAGGHLFAADGTLTQVALASGGVYAQTGNTGITNGAITTSGTNTNLTLHTPGNLNLNSYVLANGTGGIVKDGAGTLTLGKTDFMTGGLTILQGKVLLNSGSDNTVVVTPTITVPTLVNLNIVGGSIDLNGKSQALGAIVGVNSNQGGVAGTITNTGAAANFITSTATNTTDNGAINGAISLYKAGTGVLTLTQANGLSGTVNVQGGGLTLKDGGTITGASLINVNSAPLNVDNTGLSVIGNRLGTTAITSRSGELKFNGQVANVQDPMSIGALTLDAGQTNLGFGVGATNGSAVALTVASFTRNAAAGATLMVFPMGSANSSLGRVNSNAGATGLASTVVFTSGAPAVANNILGGWATANGNDWLTYAATPVAQTATNFGRTGLGILGDTASGFADYDFKAANDFTTNTVVGGYTGAYVPAASANVKLTGATGSLTVPVVSGNFVANTLNIASAAASTLNFGANTDTLNLTAGGILHSGAFNASIGTAAGNGQITAGGGSPVGDQDLFVYNNTNTLTINSKIIDNGGSKVRLIYNGYAPNNAILSLAAANAYTGGTIINGTGTGAVTLNGAAATVVIPAGGITLNNSNLTMVTNAGQIAAANAITLNDGSALVMVGTNTLDSLIFSNKGGTATPTVNTGTLLTLSPAIGTTPISVTNDNYGSTPTISGTALTLASGSTIKVDGLSPEGLSITAALTAANFIKIGNSNLILSGSNGATVTGATTLSDGGLIIGNAAALGTTTTLNIGNASPVNTVPLTIMGFVANATPLSIANNIVVNQDFTFGGTSGNATVNNGLTITGTVALGTAGRTISVTSPNVTATLGGAISGGPAAGNAGLTKAGDGILVIGQAAANTYSGDTVITGGLLKLGSAAVNAIPDASVLIVNSAGAFDINGRAETVAALKGETSTQGGIITNSSATTNTLTVGNSVPTNTTFAGVIEQGAGVLNLAKTGTSVQTLTGANTYNGSTTVTGGGLIINGSLANTVVTVQTGAYLGGTGTIGVANNAMTVNSGGSVTVNAGGAIDLRDSAIGVLTIQGNAGTTALTMAAGSALTLDTNASAVDSILVSNNAKASVSSALTVNLNGLGGSLANGVYNIINYASGNGLAVLGTLGNPGAGVVTGTDTSGASSITYNVAASALQLIVGPTGNFYWNGDQDNIWSTNNSGNTNWDTTVSGAVDAAAVPGFTDTVFFSTATAVNSGTTLGSNFSINGIQFGSGVNGTGTSASIDTANNSLTLNAAGIIVASGSAANTISSTGSGGVILGATQAWSNNATSDLTVSAPVSGTGGLIINGNGTGKVILSGNNSYSNAGGTIVQATATDSTATLKLGSTTALGAVTNTLSVNGGSGTVGRGLVDLNGNSVTIGGLIGSAGTTSGNNGSVTSATAATLTLDQSGTTTYAGTIDGSVALVKTGTGTLILALPSALTASSYTGGTTVNGGILQVGNGTAANESAGAFGTGTVTANTGGALVFNNGTKTNSTSFANNFAFNGGTVFVPLNGGNTRLATGAGATINIGAAGAIIQANGVGGGDDITLAGQLTGSGPITINNGAGSWVRFSNPDGTVAAPTYTGTVTIASGTNTMTISAGSNGTALAGAAVVNNTTASSGINFDTGINNVTFGSLAGTGAFALTTQATAGAVNVTTGGNNTSTNYTGIISAGSVAGGKIIKTGTGTFGMNATNTFSGGTVVSNGTVTTNNAAGFGATAGPLTFGDANSLSGNNATTALVTGAVTVANPIVVTSATTAGTGTATLGSSGANGIFSGGITMNGTKGVTVTATTGNTTTLSTAAITNAAAGTAVVNFTGPGNISVTSAITGTNVNKVGVTVNEGVLTGVVTLNATAGTTNYFGPTTITSGTLASGANNTLSANSDVTLANSSTALLSLSATTAGSTQNIGSLAGGGTSGGNVILGAATSNLSTGSTNATTQYDGVISGAGNLAKVGTGAMTVTNNNTYSGSTTVSNGSLIVSSTGQLSSTSSNTVGATATTAGMLEVNGFATGTTTVTGFSAGSQQGVLSGKGTVGISGQTTTIGNLGLLKPGDSAGANNGALSIGGNLTFSSGATGGAAVLGVTAPTIQDYSNISAQMGTSVSAYETYIAGQISSINSAAAGNHDTINVAGTLNLSTGTTGGVISVLDNGYVASAAVGDIFDLLDWGTLNLNGFNTGGSRYVVGGTVGDLTLPTLGAGLAWDTGLFTTAGVVVVVPEPGRAMLLLFGLMALVTRRRRQSA